MALCRVLRSIHSSTGLRYSYRLFTNDEVNHAASAAASKPPSTTVFSRILNKELPADIVYEDDKVVSRYM